MTESDLFTAAKKSIEIALCVGLDSERIVLDRNTPNHYMSCVVQSNWFSPFEWKALQHSAIEKQKELAINKVFEMSKLDSEEQ